MFPSHDRKDKTRLEELLGDDTKIQGSAPKIVPLGVSKPITERKISQKTCEFFGVTTTNSDKPNIYKHHYPYYDSEGNHVATKLRRVADKSFSVEGKTGKALLFGQHLFSSNNLKTITICEGEIDALSVFEMFAPNSYPVVSVRTGAAGAVTDCKKQYEFINSFEKIYLCFDNDEPGREASRRVAELFPPRKYISSILILKMLMIILCKINKKNLKIDTMLHKHIHQRVSYWVKILGILLLMKRSLNQYLIRGTV
jgi:twinkle protein